MLPSAYVSTLAFHSATLAAHLPEFAAAGLPVTTIFSKADQLFPVLNTLFASLHATLPAGMGAGLDDPKALRSAIRAYADNLERIEPGSEAVAKARKVLTSQLLASASKIDEQAQELALQLLDMHIAALTQRQPDTEEISTFKQIQETLETLARRARPSAKTLSAHLDALERLICDPSAPRYPLAPLQQARTALRSLTDRDAQRSAAHAMHVLVIELKQAQPTEKTSTTLITLKETYALLESVDAGKIVPASTLENQHAALQALLRGHDVPFSEEIDVEVVQEVSAALQSVVRLRTLQETLLALQKREAEIAIMHMSVLSKASSEIMEDGLSNMLPDAARLDRFSVADILDAAPDPLIHASGWMRNKFVVRRAKEISSRFTRKLAQATQAPPTHRGGERLGDLIVGTAVSNRSPQLLRYLNNVPAVGGTGTDEQMYDIWRTGMHNPFLKASDKLHLTSNLYLRGQILDPDKLITNWESKELHSADLKTVIQALIDLPVGTHAKLTTFRQEEVQKWLQALYEKCMPATFGDLVIQVSRGNGTGHLEEALLVASDQTAETAIEAYVRPGRTLENIPYLLELAAYARKPESLALLARLHPDPGALPPLLESFMPGVLQKSMYRPRDADNADMLRTIRNMINAGVSASYQDHHHFTLFHEIASLSSARARSPESLSAQVEMIDFLVARGANIGAVDTSGRTPLDLRFKILHRAGIPLATDPVIARLRHHGSTIQQAIQRIRDEIHQMPLLTPDRDRKVAGHLRLIRIMTDFMTEEVQKSAAASTNAPDTPPPSGGSTTAT